MELHSSLSLKCEEQWLWKTNGHKVFSSPEGFRLIESFPALIMPSEQAFIRVLSLHSINATEPLPTVSLAS